MQLPEPAPASPVVDKLGLVSEAFAKTAAEATGTALAHAIVQSSEDAIISKRLDGVVTSWNRRAEEMFGYSAAEMIGQPLLRLFPADRLSEEPKILERVRLGERVSHFDTMRLRKDGAAIDVSITISPIYDDTGALIGASTVIRDISMRKAYERSFEAIVAEISRLLVERTALLGESEAALLAQTQWMNAMLREYSTAERLKVEGERKRLGQELHDEVGQMLAALDLNLELIRRRTSDPGLAAPLENARRIVGDIIASLRRILHNLRPPQLDDYGLVAAVRWHIDALRPLTAMSLAFEENLGAVRLPNLVELNCFRIIQEALTNVLRHASARHAVVRIDYQPDCLQLVIDDDGVGMSAEAFHETAPGHFGLRGIEERAHAMRGRLIVASTPITGSRLTIVIPLEQDGGEGA